MRRTDNRVPQGRHHRGRTSGLGRRKHTPQSDSPTQAHAPERQPTLSAAVTQMSVGLGQLTGASAPEARWTRRPPGAGRPRA